MGFGRELKDFAEGFQKGVEIGSEQDKARAEWERYRPMKESDYGTTPGEPEGAGATVPTTDGGGQGYDYSDINIENDPQAAKVLGFIRQHEAGENPYNKLVGGKTGDLTNMTIGEVLKYQQNMIKQGHESTALGAYQFINGTLTSLVNDLKLSPDQKFDQATQDNLGYALLKRRGWDGYKAGKLDANTFMDNLAQEWAALPTASGKSAYEGVGSNRAGVSRQDFASAVDLSSPDATATAAIPEPADGTATQPAQKASFIDPETAKQMNPKIVKVVERAARDNPGAFAFNPKTKTLRTEAEQRDMVKKGWSKTMNSKHRVGKAVDLVPINPQTGQPDPDYATGYDKISKAMRKAAQDEGVDDLTWGGEWKSFQDKPHWEVSQLQEQQIQPGGLAPPIEEDEVRPTMFAQSGGVIPEPPQYFADGGMPDPMAKARALGLSGGAWVNQPGVSTPAAVGGPASFTPRRVGMAAPDAIASTGPTASQLAFRNARAAAAARPAYQAPVEQPAPVAPKPQPVRVRQQGVQAVMPYGNKGGAFGALPAAQWVKDPVTGKISQRGQRFEEGGVIPEPDDTVSYARGGSVRDTRFKELLRQESPIGPQVGDRGSGESPRDRAARRLSAEEGRASSTAYRPSQDSEYFEPADKPRVKKGKTEKKADETTTGGIKEPEIEEDRKTRFRRGDLPAEEDRATRFRRDEIEPDIEEDRATRFRRSDLPADEDRATRFRPGPVGPGGTPTEGYDTGPSGGIRTPGTPQIFPAPPPPPAAVTAPPSGPAQPKPNIGTVKTGPTAETAVKPGPKAPPAPVRTPYPPDPARTAADVADTRKRMELVTTPPANNLVPLLYDPATGQLHDPNEAPVRAVPDAPAGQWVNGMWVPSDTAMPEPNPTRFGYQEGGIIPEPGQPGYNEAVAEGQTATQEPQAEPQRANVRATPKLVSDVRKAVDGGVRFLSRQFGLGGEGAVPTPDDGATVEDGTQRFAQGEGAADPQEINSIDDQVDPTRELNEGKRQMARLAKTMRWYQGRGRKEEAEAAAGSLMQYGAARFSKLGSMSQAAYKQYLATGDPVHLDKTVKFLEKAYEMIPDGADVNVRINSETGKLEAEHTDDEGDVTYMEVDPQELPGLLKSVQDKSMYWNSIFRIADPEGAKSKDVERRTIATEQRGERSEIRKEGRAAETEAAKNERERLEKIAEEERGDVREQQKEGRTQLAEQEKEKRTAQATQNQKLLDEALLRSRPTKPTGSQKDMTVLSPLLAEAGAAKTAYEENQTPEAKDAFDLALSKVMIAAGGDASWLKTQGYDLGDFQFRDPGAAAAATAAATQPEGHPNAKRMKDPKSGQPIWAEQGADGKWVQLVVE